MTLRILRAALFCIFATHAKAKNPTDPLQNELAKLQANYEKLEGYITIYDLKTSTGKTGVIEQAIDLESQWAYLKVHLQDVDGSIVMDSEHWSTNEGELILRVGDDVNRFSMTKHLVERLHQLGDLFQIDLDVPDLSPRTTSFFTSKGPQWGMGFTGDHQLDWLGDGAKVISNDDSSTQIEWADHGKLTIDRETGLIKKQVIFIEDGEREMSLRNLILNPDASKISEKFDLDLTNVKEEKSPNAQVSRSLLRAFFQGFVKEAGENEKFENGLEKYLKDREDDFIDFLLGEALDGIPFPNQNQLINPLMSSFDAMDRKHGKMDRKMLLDDAIFRRNLSEIIGRKMRKMFGPKIARLYLQSLLGQKLQSRTPKEGIAKRELEQFLVDSFLRAKLEKAMTAYSKSLPE